VIEAIKAGLHHFQSLGWTVGAGLGVSVLTLAIAAAVVVRMPADYFVRRRAPDDLGHGHPALRWSLRLAKNLLGGVVVLLGLIMALPLVPGPGVLFVLVGLSLVDFPGKRSLERRLLRMPRVLSSVNRLRVRFGKPLMETGDGEREA
jgi:hypothetical protein